MTDCACNPSNGEAPCDRVVGPAVERLFTRISEISSLPQMAFQIMQLASSKAAQADDLVEAIRRDPALAMRLMRTVNSSYYALKDKATNLNQAIVLLGFDEVRNLALTAYVAALRETAGHGRYTRLGLWNHMVGVAMVARLIARTCGKAPLQEAYLAGLLHDVGLILIDQYDHRAFCRVVDAATDESPVWEVERQLLGFDHCSLGEFVAAKWNLPEQVTAAIGYHSHPEQYEGPHRELVCVVALANLLCHLKGLTPLGVRYTQELPARVFSALALHKQQVSAILDRLDEVLRAADVMAVFRVR